MKTDKDYAIDTINELIESKNKTKNKQLDLFKNEEHTIDNITDEIVKQETVDD